MWKKYIGIYVIFSLAPKTTLMSRDSRNISILYVKANMGNIAHFLILLCIDNFVYIYK